VIIDMVMLEKDCFDTIPALYTLASVPHIPAISGLAHLRVLSMGRRLGAHQVLSKPVAQAELLAVQELLRGE